MNNLKQLEIKKNTKITQPSVKIFQIIYIQDSLVLLESNQDKSR